MKKHDTVWMLLVGVTFLGIVTVRETDWRRYLALVNEDGLVEYLSAAVLFLAAVYAVLLARRLRDAQQDWISVSAALLIGAFFLLVGQEEISYGQRIFSIATPQIFMEMNTQQEITLHNLKPVQRMLNAIYIVAGLYGMFSGLIFDHLIKRWLPADFLTRFPVELFVVPARYALLFAPVLVMTIAWVLRHESLMAWIRQPDEEPAELFLYLGCCLFIRDKYLMWRRVQ